LEQERITTWQGLQPHFVFDVANKDQYVTWSENLELITLHEAMSADGAAVHPAFVVGKMPPAGW